MLSDLRALALLSLTASLLLDSVAYAGELRVDLSGSCKNGQIVATRICAAGSAGCRAETTVHPFAVVAGQGSAVLDLEDTVAWELAVHGDNCWSAPAVIGTGAARPTTVALHIWPLGALTGTFAVPKGEDLPSDVAARIQSVPLAGGQTDPAPIPETAVPCERKESAWRCPVPATPLDVRLEAAGYAPHYLWGVSAPVAGKADLGELQLRRGGSVSGRVSLAGRAPVEGIDVELVPIQQAGSAVAQERLRSLVRRTRTNARGFFQFAGVEEGGYSAIARKTEWSSARADGIKVDERRESAIPHPLLMQRLTRLEVVIDPPLDEGGASWPISLDRYALSGSFERAAQGVASKDGRWAAAGVEAGMYRLSLGRSGQLRHDQAVEVSPGMPPVVVTIPEVFVRGTVTFDGKPVPGWIRFRAWGDRRLQWLPLDEDGKFEGTLPGEGRWSVQVTREGKKAGISLPDDVTIKRQPSGPTILDFELPGGKVSGTAVNSEGKAVEAVVSLRSLSRGGESTVADAAGKFVIEGVAPGDYLIRGATADGDSGFLPHTIHGLSDDEVRIVIPKQRLLRGYVVSPAGNAVPGATVRYVDASERWHNLITGLSGEFSIGVTAAQPAATFSVLAAGFPAKLLTMVPGDDDRPKEIPLSPASGSLLVRCSTISCPAQIAGSGIPVSIYVLLFPSAGPPAESVRGGFNLQLEPGTYTVCPSRAASDRCVTKIVRAGGNETVDATEENAP